MPEIIGYQVRDCQTGETVKSYQTGKGRLARAYAAKLNAAYGATRYIVALI